MVLRGSKEKIAASHGGVLPPVTPAVRDCRWAKPPLARSRHHACDVRNDFGQRVDRPLSCVVRELGDVHGVRSMDVAQSGPIAECRKHRVGELSDPSIPAWAWDCDAPNRGSIDLLDPRGSVITGNDRHAVPELWQPARETYEIADDPAECRLRRKPAVDQHDMKRISSVRVVITQGSRSTRLHPKHSTRPT